MKKVATIIITALLAITLVIVSIVLAKPSEAEAISDEVDTVAITTHEEPKAMVPAVEPDSSGPKWHYFNLDLQGDGVSGNEYNFGCMPDCEVTPHAMDIAFRNRLNQDPALGAADMAWFDANLGTRYLGVFYDECNEHWDAAINKAKSEWIDDPDAYFETLDAFFMYLDSAVNVEIREQKNLDDQMYMNPFTVNRIPDVIVMETDEHEGNFLVYTFMIKDTKKVEVAYRLECGFQPCNVAEIMKITPKKRSGGGGGSTPIAGGGKLNTIAGGGPKPGPKPTPTPKPKPTPKPTPTPTPPPPTPTPTPPPPDPTPTPTPEHKKDPTEGTPVLPNDDPGPGPNTNNPSDPNHSTKEPENASTTMTQPQYEQTIQEIKDANNESKSGGEPSTPSTPPPTPETHVDSNADSGSDGNPGIDQPTETTESSVSDEPAGEAWDGPPD